MCTLQHYMYMYTHTYITCMYVCVHNTRMLYVVPVRTGYRYRYRHNNNNNKCTHTHDMYVCFLSMYVCMY